jgi:hypothetical protein
MDMIRNTRCRRSRAPAMSSSVTSESTLGADISLEDRVASGVARCLVLVRAVEVPGAQDPAMVPSGAGDPLGVGALRAMVALGMRALRAVDPTAVSADPGGRSDADLGLDPDKCIRASTSCPVRPSSSEFVCTSF